MTNPTGYISLGGLRVAPALRDFVEEEALTASGLTADRFWDGVREIVTELMPVNRALLAERDRLQAELDTWHDGHRDEPHDPDAYRAHLERIGYLLPEPDHVTITTQDVDDEIAQLAGPQLVVPVTNARYALNAANARWGSLYDAFYGTDALPGDVTRGGYDRTRGALVVATVRDLLDEFFPLTNGGHSEATAYLISNGALVIPQGNGTSAQLADPGGFRGYRGDAAAPTAILLQRHGLHLEIQLDATSPIARDDRAGVSDVLIEGALTTIVDFEDSVAVVDAEDKVTAYRNWLGLSRGDLTDVFEKNGALVTRRLADDRRYVSADGGELVLPGRALLFVRNVGHLMTTDAVLDRTGEEIGEGILDALLTTLCALPGLRADNPKRNGHRG